MLTQRIGRSASLGEACESFLDELDAWVTACCERFASTPPSNVHDQATFTTSWGPAVRERGNRRALDFMRRLRDRVSRHLVQAGLWRHGYWRLADVHHGPEHFFVFLGSLWRLDPHDPATATHLCDAAEHFGNWASGVPPWFDRDALLFRSLRFGTEQVEPPAAPINLPVHLRCVAICLLAHEMTGDRRYLDLSVAYTRRWAEAVVAQDRLPAALGPQGPLYELSGAAESEYRSFAGEAPDLATDLERAETFTASDAVAILLKLRRLDHGAVFLQAARRLVEAAATQLEDPDAGVAADLVRTWRKATGDHRFDPRVLEACGRLNPFGFSELGLEPHPDRKRRPPGLGKRSDLPLWFEDGAPRRHNPILLGLAAEVAGDAGLATRAVDIARACFSLARRCYPDGRNNGCAARTVNAIARGHGRDNGAGVLTAVLAPLLRFKPR